MTIEILYVDGCPNHRPTVERVRHVLHELRMPDEWAEVRITDPAMANALVFPGSPTVRVNGQDIEPSARTGDQAGFGCRLYRNGSHWDGVPSEQLIRQALLDPSRR